MVDNIAWSNQKIIHTLETDQGVDASILHHPFISIFIALWAVITLCHNTYAYSLLFYKVYIKRENAGRWDSGVEKEQILGGYSAQLQKF